MTVHHDHDQLDGPVLLVAGARPNFMKVGPLQAELDRRGLPNRLVHTGQHYDPAMSDVFFDELGIRAPDHHLEVGSGSHAVQTARIMEAFEPVVLAEEPSWVVVPGDVNSTLACSLVAAKLGVRVAHLEAGLRSRDWAMPEEVNRVVTDRISDLLLAPSPDAVDNLAAEGYPAEFVALVGNVMADTLLTNLDRARSRPVLGDLGLTAGGYGLITLHRPSNVDDPEVLARLLVVLGELAEQTPMVWPVHPRVRPALAALTLPAGIRAIDPVGYLDSIALQSGAALVLTDSGGVQEETTVLGVPCVTLRTTTERPITITHGTNQLAGTDPDAIRAAAARALSGEITGIRPDLWDGKTAVRCVDALLAAPPRTRPVAPMPKTVVTFGTFDVFHIGHLRVLERAKALGDRLVVGVSSDALNRSKKGRDPVFPEKERVRIVAALAVVDEVFLEESLDLKRQYLVDNGADVLVMGDDWAGRFDEFDDICNVVYLPRTPSISTTAIIEKISGEV